MANIGECMQTPVDETCNDTIDTKEMVSDELLKQYFDVAHMLAIEAGKMILDGFNTRGNQVYFKDATDLVTQTDRACEQLILSTLKQAFPDHMFVGEESVAEGVMCEVLTNTPTWIVDPVDGTTNFVHKFPFSCVSIALAIDKKVVVGIVYNPMMKEMFTAIRGQGAQLNGQPIHVSSNTTMQHALIATGFPYGRTDALMDPVFDNMKRVLKSCRDLRRVGSAALDMCYVARGVFDLYYEAGIHAWDIAAGALIVEEAGGHVDDMYDDPFTLTLRRVACGNTSMVQQLQSILKRPSPKNESLSSQ